jgi:hypothetical protein
MRKIKAIFSDYPSNVDRNIQLWMSENPDISIISVNGITRGENGDSVTYILYEPKKEGISLNS